MRLSQLQYLVALERCGSISQAAQALYVSQPSISVGIRELEEELGCPLLVRSNKGITFTTEGAQILLHAKTVLDEIEAIRQIGGEKGIPAGTIRIGSTPHYCNSILLDVMMKVQKACPQISIFLEEHDSESVIRRVLEGSLELGMIQVCDVDEEQLLEKVQRKELAFDEMFSEALDIVVGENHPLAKQETVSLSDVLKYPYAAFRGAMNKYIESQFPQGSQVAHINDIVSLRQFILRTDYFAVIPHRAVLYGNNIYQGNFVSLPISDIKWNSKVGIVRPAGNVRALERIVLNELENRCKEYQE